MPREAAEPSRGSRVVVAVAGSAGSKALRFALGDAARRALPVEAVIAYRAPELWMDYNALGSEEEQELHRGCSTTMRTGSGP